MKKTAMNLGLQALALLVLCAGPLAAGAPLKINFQGRLDESGQPAEGSKSFAFKLYDAASGGTLVWTSQTQAVAVSQGVFSAVLSTGTPADLSTATFSGARYVEIIVDGVPLSPRQEMVSAPYAMVAQALAPDAQLPAAAIADGSVTDAKVSLTTAAVSAGRFGDDRVQITTGAVASGKFGDGRVYISTGAFYGGFNAADKLVQLDGAGKLPALDGSALTSVNSVQLTALTLSTAPLANAANWDAAYGWGNHASAGYAGAVSVGTATGTLRTDLNGVIASTAPLAKAANWDAAYGWGNHASAGYAGLASSQSFTGSAAFSSTAAFTALSDSAPGVTVSSGLVVLNGPVGLGTASPTSTLSVGGSLSLPIKRVALADSPYSVTGNDFTILADSTDGDVTVTLPDAAAVPGRLYSVKRVVGVNNIYLGAVGGLLDGAASQVMNSLQGEVITVQSDGTDWNILNWYWQ